MKSSISYMTIPGAKAGTSPPVDEPIDSGIPLVPTRVAAGVAKDKEDNDQREEDVTLTDHEEDTREAREGEAASSSTPSGSEPDSKPYSIYTSREKWIIVAIVSIGGFFSPLTANIYFPAIPTIATAFNKSISLINLSVTIYMVFQGVAPMFWGTLSDYKGRRPIFLLCLLTLALSCMGLALIPTNAYWLLMLLRALQAIGSASSIALGAGVIGDIATPEQRGGMFGIFGVAPLVAPAVAPVIGGVMTEKLGWRWIFWLVCIASALCFIFLLLILPETLRVIVGDGSILPPKLYRPLFPVVGRGRHRVSSQPRPPPKRFTNPLILLTYPDILLLLLTNGVGTGVFYSVSTSMTPLFEDAYPFLSTAEIGYCYLAMGGAMSIATAFAGKFLDAEYMRMKRKTLIAEGVDVEKIGNIKTIPMKESFPIERVRLRTLPAIFLFYIGAVAGYGWCVQARVSLAGVLILQCIIGFCSIWILTSTQTLLIDLVPESTSSVTACNNLVRCGTGAIMVSIVEPIISGIGVGWTYILFGALAVLGAFATLGAVTIGPKYRGKRKRKKECSDEKDREKLKEKEEEKQRRLSNASQ